MARRVGRPTVTLYVTRDYHGIRVWAYRPHWSRIDKEWQHGGGHLGPFCRRGFQRATGVRIAEDWEGAHAIRRVYFNLRLIPEPRAQPKKRRAK